jgi:hypothetical protein
MKSSAHEFVRELGATAIPNLYGVTDGKAVGTYVEQTFRNYLNARFSYTPGNSALGIDFPELEVDLKVTSINKPQSSCPFTSASQKVYGLGYHLLVFVYEKLDNPATRAARLNFLHALFISRERTADYQTTYGLLGILSRNGNREDVVAFLEERNLPLDEVGRTALAEQILQQPPLLGCLTVSNALQWRLQYGRAISLADAGGAEGVESLLA